MTTSTYSPGHPGPELPPVDRGIGGRPEASPGGRRRIQENAPARVDPVWVSNRLPYLMQTGLQTGHPLEDLEVLGGDFSSKMIEFVGCAWLRSLSSFGKRCLDMLLMFLGC